MGSGLVLDMAAVSLLIVIVNVIFWGLFGTSVLGLYRIYKNNKENNDESNRGPRV